jgi:hypothetical protein
MNDTIITSSKTANNRLRLFAIVLLILVVSAGYYIWGKKDLPIKSSLLATQINVKVYDTKKIWYEYESVLFNCITEIKYNKEPTITKYYYMREDEVQKTREECIPL